MGKHTFDNNSKKNDSIKPQMSRLVYREMQRMKDEQTNNASNKFTKFMSQFYLPDKQAKSKNISKSSQPKIGKHVKMHNGKIVKAYPYKTYISLLIIFIVAFGIYCLKSSNVNSAHSDNIKSSISSSSKSSVKSSQLSSSNDDETDTRETSDSYYVDNSYSNNHSTNYYNRQSNNNRYSNYYSSSSEYNNRYYNNNSSYSSHNYRRYNNDQQYSNSYVNQKSQDSFINNSNVPTEKD